MYTVLPPDPVAQDQIDALPDEALGYLAELFTLLETAPWTGRSANPSNPDANMLTMPFGERGLITYLVLERTREVYVVRVQWL